MEILRPFGDRPVVVKDYVKSRKHEWAEACFIPSAADGAAVRRIAGRFIELQERDLVGGLVFREFIEFEPLGRHPRSGMPLTKEFRIFWLDGRPLSWFPYWDEGEYGGLAPPVDEFADLARRVRSRFFSMDVAERAVGGWLVIELGDGQVAGLPARADVRSFYEALAGSDHVDGSAR
jgi:hypothetical protein